MNMFAEKFILIALIAIIAMFAVSWFFKRSSQSDGQAGSGIWFGIFGHDPDNNDSSDTDGGDGGD